TIRWATLAPTRGSSESSCVLAVLMLTTPVGAAVAADSGIAASDAEATRMAMMKIGRDFRMGFFSFRLLVCRWLPGNALFSADHIRGLSISSLVHISC